MDILIEKEVMDKFEEIANEKNMSNEELLTDIVEKHLE